MLAALRASTAAASPSACAAACAALRSLAVNDESCLSLADAGAVELLLAELGEGSLGSRAAPAASAAAAHACQTRALLSALRQLAGADAVKVRFASAGGLPLLSTLLSRCKALGPATSESLLALLAALSLRQPELVASAAACGALEGAMEALSSFPGHAGVQRAGCMVLRNAAARNPELRKALSDSGAEVLLVAAKKAHPGPCGDVGSAALRDLGADNYNEGWSVTNVYMGAEGQLFSYEELGGADEDAEELSRDAAAAEEED